MMSKRTWIILGIIVIVMFAGGLILTSKANLKDTEQATINNVILKSDWWDLNWHWRRSINITNDSGSAITSACPVKMTIPYYDKSGDHNMQTNFADIRFTDVNQVPLSYFLESYTASEAIVWVELPVIPTGTTTIYLYYGNSAVSDSSNGANTFLFYDDFETGALNVTDSTRNNFWTVVNPTRGAYDIVSSLWTPNPTTPVATSGWQGNNYLRIRSTSSAYTLRANLRSTVTVSCVAEFWAQPAQTNAEWRMQGISSGSKIEPYFRFTNNGILQYYHSTTAVNTVNPYSASSWYKFTMDKINISTDRWEPNIGVDNGTITVYPNPQGTLSNGTGVATGSPVTLYYGTNTITVTTAGTFTVTLPLGLNAGTASSGTAVIKNSPVTLNQNATTTITANSTGTFTITLSDPSFNATGTDMKYIGFLSNTNSCTLFVDMVRARLYYDPVLVTYEIGTSDQ